MTEPNINFKAGAWIMLVVGVVLLAVNHANVVSEQKVYPWAILVGPLALFLGIGGAIKPEILQAAGKYGKHLPTHLKAIAVILVVAGLTTSALLFFVVYPLQ